MWQLGYRGQPQPWDEVFVGQREQILHFSPPNNYKGMAERLNSGVEKIYLMVRSLTALRVKLQQLRNFVNRHVLCYFLPCS